MFSFPSSRRLVAPALLFFTIIAIIRLYLGLRDSVSYHLFESILVRSSTRLNYNITFAASPSPRITIQQRFLEQHLANATVFSPNEHIARLLSSCKRAPNPHTNHIRLSQYPILNISMVPSAADSLAEEFRTNRYFNPAILSLPSHVTASSTTPYEYLLVSRLVTTGTHQESHICFANICSPLDIAFDHRICTDEDIEILGQRGGMRCVTRPEKVNIPSTPARKCTGSWEIFPDIPGFHDPRVFWSGRDEPLIEVNSGSTYGCVGLWLQDLRSVFPPLDTILKQKRRIRRDDNFNEQDKVISSTSDDVKSLGPPIYYPKLTELTRNPRSSRASVEKNWIVFFPTEDATYLQYNTMAKPDLRDHSLTPPLLELRSDPGRSISQLLSHGLTSPNLTSPLEPPCFNTNHPSHIADSLNNTGHWHQGTNSLRLILCSRADFLARHCNTRHVSDTATSEENAKVEVMSAAQYAEYLRKDGAIVHFSIIHRKFTNEMDLPMRYERYVLVWEARVPFRVVAVSQWPIVFGRERVRPWSVREDLDLGHVFERRGEHDSNGTVAASKEQTWEETMGGSDVYFTYTPSIAWAHRRGDGRSDEGEDRERGHENLGTGYLDDEVVVGIGKDDMGQGFVKVPVRELLSCLRDCPGVGGKIGR